jgi:antitoxin component of MazEF toxin-antitoxin module
MPAMPVARLYKQGNSLALNLPKEISDELSLVRGDQVLIEVIGGRIEITRVDVDYYKATDTGRKCASKYRDVLSELDKR